MTLGVDGNDIFLFRFSPLCIYWFQREDEGRGREGERKREGGWERETETYRHTDKQTNMDVRREILIGCFLPALQPGTELLPRYVPWLVIKPMTFQCMGRRSNKLSHTGWAGLPFLILFPEYRKCGEQGYWTQRPSCAEWQFKNNKDKEHHSQEGRCFNLRCLHSPSVV